MDLKNFIILCVYISTTTVKACSQIATEGYYWRQFGGDIPHDALPGGSDANGKPIYIGQVLYKTMLIPAKIYENDPKAYFQWHGVHTATTAVKILCTQNPENFVWILRNKENMHLLINEHVIEGGYESNALTYIGRVFNEGETTIGKIIVDVNGNNRNVRMFVTKNGLSLIFYSFEVLTYKPQCSKLNAVVKTTNEGGISTADNKM